MDCNKYTTLVRDVDGGGVGLERGGGRRNRKYMETLPFLLYFTMNLNLLLKKIKFINKKVKERKKSRNTGEEYCKQRKQRVQRALCKSE